MADIGNIYTRDGQEFTGSTFSEHLYLLAPYGQAASNFALNAPFKISYNNVKIGASSSRRIILGIAASPSIGACDIALESNGNINLWCNYGNFVNTTIITYSADNYYDFEVEYNGAGTITARVKLSSDSNWSSKTYSYTFLSNTLSRDSYVGSSNTEGDISNVLVTSNGTVLFSRDPVTPSVPIPKIGSNDISKIYLGSEEISKIYLGSEVVYEAEVTPPAPTGPVFDLDASIYNTSSGNWSDKDAFLRGENVDLTLTTATDYAMLMVTCNDWSNVGKLRASANYKFATSTTSAGYYDTNNVWHSLHLSYTGNEKTIFVTIPSNIDKSTISKVRMSYISGAYTATFSDFKVYDDNGNIIIPAS